MKTKNRILTDTNGQAPKVKVQELRITEPVIRNVTCEIAGTAPYVSNKMGASELQRMKMAVTSPGTQAKKKREARDFEAQYQESMHVTPEGWYGVPTNAFLHALIRSCKLVGFEMTDAKMSLAVKPHGISTDGIPLVRLQGKPEQFEARVVTKGTPNIAVRAMWRQWSISGLRIEFDRDILSVHDVSNLLMRAGLQVGIGAGRPFSATSPGMGWGTFKVVSWTSDDK